MIHSKNLRDYRRLCFLMRGEIVSCSTILILIIKVKCVQSVSTSYKNIKSYKEKINHIEKNCEHIYCERCTSVFLP